MASASTNPSSSPLLGTPSGPSLSNIPKSIDSSALASDCDMNGTWATMIEVDVEWPATTLKAGQDTLVSLLEAVVVDTPELIEPPAPTWSTAPETPPPVELLDEVQVRAINIANGKNFLETPTLIFEFIGTGKIRSPARPGRRISGESNSIRAVINSHSTFPFRRGSLIIC